MNTYLNHKLKSTSLIFGLLLSASVFGQVPSAPSSIYGVHKCGYTQLSYIPTNKPSNETWYWQTSQYGMSTSYSHYLHNVYSNGHHYLRARNNSSGLWGPSTIFYVYQIKPVPGTPSNPTISSNSCGTRTVTRGTPPSNVTWYWQTSSSGTSTSNSQHSYSVSSSRPVYLRARHNNGCWGGTRSVYVSVGLVPSIPSVPTLTSNTCGPKTVTRGTPPTGVTWYWQTSSGGTSTSNSGPTYIMVSSGYIYLRAKSSSGCWGSSRSVYATVTYPSTPSAPSVSTNTCGNKILTKGSAPYAVVWYWQTSLGSTSTAHSGSTYEVSSSGTYYLRPRDIAGCWGPAQMITVTVNKPDPPEIIASEPVCGGVHLELSSVRPSGVTWYWQGSDPEGTSTEVEDSEFISSPGTYYIRAKDNMGCWSNSTAFDVTSIREIPDAPPEPVISINACGNKILVRTGSPQYYHSWFWQSSADGTSTLHSGATYETNGLGTYYLRAKNMAFGCWGGSVSVEVTNVSGEVNVGQCYTEQYNGNIAAIKWKKANSDHEQLYTYSYDALNRLKRAQYSEGASNGGSSWTTLTNQGAYSIPTLEYDLNGNIMSLNRQTLHENVNLLDELFYTYDGNQLLSVSDVGDIEEGFKDGNNSNDDYAYDRNGNMTQDLNKEIVSIEYNHLNLPELVTKADGRYIEYVYDAAGVKLTQKVYDAFDNLIKKIDYSGDFVYEDGELVLIQHEEGRIVLDPTTGNYDYEYYLKDHLGNTRVVFTTDPKTIDFTLNYEGNSADPDDETLFDNLQNVITADVHDRVDAPNESFNHTNVQALNGATNGVIGSVLTIPVGAGDKINAEVYAKYLAPTSKNNPAAAIGNLIIGAITGSTGVNNYEGAINNGYGSSGTVTNLINANASSTDPMAFINLLFLPDDVTGSIATDHFAFKQITSASSNSQAILALDRPYEAPESGYVVVYLSNESAQLTEVYFDDLQVTVEEHPVVQKVDYYPFGYEMAGGYQRVTAKENDYLFAGKERQDELEVGWYDFGARMYAPDIARWNGIDNSAENYVNQSPYHYSGNNPILFVDFDGNDYGVKVDRGNKTITIKAHFLTSSKSAKAFKTHGSGRWNAQSAKNVFVAGGLKALRKGKADVYKINISLTSEVSGGADGQGRGVSDRDSQVRKDNTGTLNSFDVETKGFKDNQGGGTTNDKVDMRKGKEDSNITTHEVNHAMGIAHTGEDGGNQSPSGGGSVGAAQIGETLKGVGIGGDNSNRNSSGSTYPVGDGTLLNGSSNSGLENGKVISVNKYNRIMNRIKKREERRNN
ncbi:MAG: RHS repeat-associated core domain-containing protein [Bacteroidota bacterium]